jgi:hypothetical protein
MDSEFFNCTYWKSLQGLPTCTLWILLTRTLSTTICVHGLDV